MANPNIVNVATINGKTQTFALDTTLTTSLVANAGSSGKIFKINTIIVTNIDGTTARAAGAHTTSIDSSPHTEPSDRVKSFRVSSMTTAM